MPFAPSSRRPAGPSFLYLCLGLFFLSFTATVHALAHSLQKPIEETRPAEQGHWGRLTSAQFSEETDRGQYHATNQSRSEAPAETLRDLLNALHVMQDKYFVLWMGAWPTSIDWTAAVLGTHVAATLSSLTSRPPDVNNTAQEREASFIALENTVNHFFSHTTTFYFGENAFSIRNQAYDDMLWVVLDWLENIKFQGLHTALHYPTTSLVNNTSKQAWHGTQFQDAAAHRSRIFYELASAGWDKTQCGGGMIWNPSLLPYKNAITNELYISASIAMYLYFPGDPIDAPFLAKGDSKKQYPHNPEHLKAAVDAYAWLKNSNMTGQGGLYADGFHITLTPGPPKCDVLNTMIYTYNQGVVLSGLRGLWLATGSQDYLNDGHDLIAKVLYATGWPQTSSTTWAGLGRGGVLEDACDSHATCSQDGQSFKGIFFHHLAEFCLPLRPQEEQFLAGGTLRSGPNGTNEDWGEVYRRHLRQCDDYGPWIEHNALAALMTLDDDGKFGMWWGLPFRQTMASTATVNSSTLPVDAVDYRNDESNLDFSTEAVPRDFNDQGRGRTVETQSGGIAVLRALFQWQTYNATHES